jgi:hypothetical protein
LAIPVDKKMEKILEKCKQQKKIVKKLKSQLKKKRLLLLNKILKVVIIIPKLNALKNYNIKFI